MDKLICTHYLSIFLFSKKACWLFLNGCFILIIYSGVPLYLPTEEKYKQRLYGNRQNAINESKPSGTKTPNWERYSLYPVTTCFCKCLSRFSSGLAWEFISACSTAAGQKSLDQTSKAFSSCLPKNQKLRKSIAPGSLRCQVCTAATEPSTARSMGSKESRQEDG